MIDINTITHIVIGIATYKLIKFLFNMILVRVITHIGSTNDTGIEEDKYEPLKWNLKNMPSDEEFKEFQHNQAVEMMKIIWDMKDKDNTNN